MTTRKARAERPAHGRRSAGPVRRSSPLRGAWLTTGLLGAVILAALSTTGGSYALWNDSAQAAVAPVTSGSTALVITQQSALDLTALLPGQGVIGTFTARNSGTVPLATAVAVSATSSSASFPGELSVRLGSVTSTGACVSGATTWSGRPGSLATNSSFARIAPGASSIVCVEVVLDADAPETVQGATAKLGFTVTGTQVQP